MEFLAIPPANCGRRRSPGLAVVIFEVAWGHTTALKWAPMPKMRIKKAYLDTISRYITTADTEREREDLKALVKAHFNGIRSLHVIRAALARRGIEL